MSGIHNKTSLKYQRQNSRPTEELAWKNMASRAKALGMSLGEYLIYCLEVNTFAREQEGPKIRVSRMIINIPRSVGEPLHSVRIGVLGLENY